MAYITDTRGLGAALADRAAAIITSLREANEKRRIYRTTLHELRVLSDRELADLGIHRSAIAGIAHEAAYGPRA